MPEKLVERVQRMEEAFDRLQHSFDLELLRQLQEYYECGQWLCDYEADEAGLLPPELKRGVLSQDSVYDLLTRLREKPPEIE